MTLHFDNTYVHLPAGFFSRVAPTAVSEPRLVKYNRALGSELGLDIDAGNPGALAEIFSGNALLPGSEPLAMAYAGHQFGQFVPQLGDGRAILLGEVVDNAGKRRDIQLKGAGRTPYSRGGDGRAALGPVLREYLVSEAMFALGIPATRALAVVTTGEAVFREERLPGAIVTRVAASHVRVGTFQYFASRGDVEATRRLADYVIGRHYPAAASAANAYLELLRLVVERQAALVARWMLVGFIHGVMNTDNMTVSGETIDFGPCAFMDAYDPGTVFSSIDRGGRYAYSNQPQAAQWNLARLAETLLPLIDPVIERAIAPATEVVSAFTVRFEEQWSAGMRAKLGLSNAEEGDAELFATLLVGMQRARADFTATFRWLSGRAAQGEGADLHGESGDERVQADAFGLADWMASWRMRCARNPLAGVQRAAAMRAVNPAFIPRNHRIEQVIAAAVGSANYAPFEELASVLARPYEDQPAHARYADVPLPEERVLQTFCGT